jgi:hypothetical protein
MRRHHVAAVLAALCAPSLLAALPELAGGSTAVWRDAVGDARSGAADIDSLSVWRARDGAVTFRLTFADRGELTPDDSIGFMIDADADRSTGINGGIDDVVTVGAGNAVFLDVTGLRVELEPSAIVRTDHTIAVSIDSVLLGDTRRLVVAGVSGLESDGSAFDETDRDSFSLSSPAAIVSSLRISPARSVVAAGTRVTAHVSVRFGLRAAAVPATWTCRMTLAGRPVRPVAPCSWKVPRAAAGRRVVITADGLFDGRAFRPKALVLRVR